MSITQRLSRGRLRRSAAIVLMPASGAVAAATRIQGAGRSREEMESPGILCGKAGGRSGGMRRRKVETAGGSKGPVRRQEVRAFGC